MVSRTEHLAWCKKRALELLDAGHHAQAVASMISDLRKWEGGELYEPELFRTLCADGMLFCKTKEQTRHWIEGFN